MNNNKIVIIMLISLIQDNITYNISLHPNHNSRNQAQLLFSFYLIEAPRR